MLINHNGAASIDTLCQVLQLFLYYPTVHTIFRVVLPRHLQGICGELPFWFLQWGSSAQTKYPLVHSPHPKIHHRVDMDGILINARNCVLGSVLSLYSHKYHVHT